MNFAEQIENISRKYKAKNLSTVFAETLNLINEQKKSIKVLKITREGVVFSPGSWFSPFQRRKLKKAIIKIIELKLIGK